MKIGITGGKGFIGSSLIKCLSEKSISFVEINKTNMHSEDMRDIKHIIHLASKTSVESSWRHISDYIDSNVTFTASVLDLAKKIGASVTLCSSYGSPMNILKPGEAPTPYHLTKLFCEELCYFYNKNFHIPVVILKLANVYGVNQKSHFLIPTIINQVLDPCIHTILVNNLRPKRCFIDVRDVVSFMMLSIPKDNHYGVYYVGPQDSHSVEDIIKICMNISEVSKKYDQRSFERQNEIEINLSHLTGYQKINWQPKYSLDEGLRHFIEHEQKKLSTL